MKKVSEAKKEIKNFFLDKNISVIVTDMKNKEKIFESDSFIDDVLFSKNEVRFISETGRGVVLPPKETMFLMRFGCMKIINSETSEIYEIAVA